jgi:hypothetical protein
MKRIVLGALFLVSVLAASLLWIALQARPKHAKTVRHGDDEVVRPETDERVALPPPSVVAHAPSPGDAEPRTLPDGTIVDRQRRDAVRQQLLAAHPPEPEPSTPESAAAAAPSIPPLDALEIPGKLDPKYIQDRIHEDYFPLARGCYDEAAKRKPGLRGRLAMHFKIVGDQKIGGIVENAHFGEGTDIDDPEFRTCMRESLLSVAFKAPDEGGEVEVEYPIEFSPGDDEDDAGSD